MICSKGSIRQQNIFQHGIGRENDQLRICPHA
jgi:hypothetical protein